MSVNNFRRQLITKININEELQLGNLMLADREDRQVVKQTLVMQTTDEIDLDVLKAYLEAEKEYGEPDKTFRYRALQLKYKALTTAPTTIEKTMSPAQLYASGSPLWAHDYDIVKIDRILARLNDKPKTEESFNEALEAIQVQTTYVDKYGRTYVG